LRDVQPGQAADAAVGGKQCGEETRGNLPGNNRTPGYCSGGLTSPDSVLTTAEDSLLVPPRDVEPAANLLHQQYSGDPGA
jgi:hypothetical protein